MLLRKPEKYTLAIYPHFRAIFHMNYTIKVSQPETAHTECLVIGVYTEKLLSDAAQSVNVSTSGAIKKVLNHGDMTGKLGETQMLYDIDGVAAKRILLVGLGKAKSITIKQFQNLHNSVTKQLQKGGTTDVLSYLHEIKINNQSEAQKVQQVVAAVGNALYRFTEHKSSAPEIKVPLKKWQLGVNSRKDLAKLEKAILIGAALTDGMSMTKDLGNQPGNVATPSYLADQAHALAKQYSNIKVSVLDEKELEEMGAGAFISVSKGSTEPGKLIIMEYHENKKSDQPVVLVGKGVTFDSGGISLKPGAAMDEMKYDMCGAASVFGTMKAIAEMKATVNLICVIAAAENMPAGNASKPGDVVTTLSGKTVEILNTDAEGRLVLCDALTYVERFNPKVVIDIATLTGAVIIALGKIPSGLMSNNNKLASELESIGQETGDRVWRLPIWDDYQSQLNSNFADLQNIGGREGGTITAACFLSHFTKKYNWAHLDIAGTAWSSGTNKGASGRPVPLLTQYLLDKHSS